MVSPIGNRLDYNSFLTSYGLFGNRVNKTGHTLGSMGNLSVKKIAPIQVVSPQQQRLTEALSQVRSMFGKLKPAANLVIASKENNVFAKRIAVTSDSAALTAVAKDKATPGSYQISISKLASSQENTGTSFNANGNAMASGFALGNNSFKLTYGNTTKSLDFNVTASDSNKTVLTNLASTINQAKAGITAKVVDAVAGGVTTSKIILSTDKTGTDQAFSLTEETGNVISLSGADKRTTESGNAQYSVNGEARTSQSNIVAIDNDKVAFTLKTVTSQPVTATVQSDNRSILNGITNFAKSYNETLNALRDNSDIMSTHQGQKLSRLVSDNRTQLADIGITVKSDKTIAVDTVKLEKAINNNFDSVSKAIGGVSGLGSQTAKMAESVLLKPIASLSRIDEDASVSNSSYKLQLNQYRNHNMAAMFNQLYGAGGIIDTFA